MGSYTDFSVAGYPVLESKSYAATEAMTVFRETDKRIFDRSLAERNPIVWGTPEGADASEIERALTYDASVRMVKDRLEIMGFTLRRIGDDFDRIKEDKIAEYESWIEESSDSGSDFMSHIRRQIEQLESLNFPDYLEALREFVALRIRVSRRTRDIREHSNPLVSYIASSDNDEDFGFFFDDARSLIRVFCEVSEDSERVIQDLTEVAHAGYYRWDCVAANDAVVELTASYPESSRQIILTEGSTDARILDQAMQLLYPHLRDYYSFLDFEASRSSGGAGHLAGLVKAFAGAGITNRVIALFDNDTAGREAAAALKHVSIPSNIAVTHYPDLDYLKAYDTIGPTGSSVANVNGVAASIELYLGHDVLVEPDGSRLPVQWKGYSEAMKAYQGEVLHKASIRDRFQSKLVRATSQGIDEGDWTGLHSILQQIFRAFAD